MLAVGTMVVIEHEPSEAAVRRGRVGRPTTVAVQIERLDSQQRTLVHGWVLTLY